MRLGAKVLVGGGSSADGRFCPGLRKRWGVAALPCREGCSRSLVPVAALPDEVCARLSAGGKATSVMAAAAASAGAPTRRLKRENPAIKAGTSIAVRVTSEAAKAHHHCGAEMAAGDSFPCGNRAITGTAPRRPRG